MAKKKTDDNQNNALALLQGDLLEDQSRLQEEAEESRFLARLTLNTPVSKAFTEHGITPGNYVLGGNTDLGPEVLAVVGPARPHAIHFEDGQIKAESFDMDDESYKRIKAGAKKWAQGMSYGPEFLIWLPVQGTFATVHPTRSSFDAGKELIRRTGKLVRLSSKTLANKRKTKVITVSDADAGGTDLTVDENKFRAAVEEFTSYRNPTPETSRER